MVQEQYCIPSVGSIAPLVSRDAKDITGDLINNLSSLLGKRGIIDSNAIMPMHHDSKVVHLKQYLERFPKRLHEQYWIDTGKGLVVIHPGTLLPFFLNESGSKICKLCNGRHSVKEILDIFTKRLVSQPEDTLKTDFMKFLLLIEELDLISL